MGTFSLPLFCMLVALKNLRKVILVLSGHCFADGSPWGSPLSMLPLKLQMQEQEGVVWWQMSPAWPHTSSFCSRTAFPDRQEQATLLLGVRFSVYSCWSHYCMLLFCYCCLSRDKLLLQVSVILVGPVNWYPQMPMKARNAAV